MMALAVVGGIFQAVGSLAAGAADARADRYNEAVDKRNQQIALSQGAAAAAQQQRENELKMGRLRAAFGDAGLGFAGSALTIYHDAAQQTELDKQTIRYNAQLRGIGYSDQANLDHMKASADSTAGILGAFNGIIGAGNTILKAA